MSIFSQLRQYIHSRQQQQQTDKFVAKNVYTSVELTKIRLRAVYSFTRYIDCTIRWLVVTLLSVICVLMVRLVVNTFEGDDSVLALAQAAAIDFNSASASQDDGQSNRETHTAIEFPSFGQSSRTDPSLSEHNQPASNHQPTSTEYSSHEWGSQDNVATEPKNQSRNTRQHVVEHTAIDFPSMSGPVRISEGSGRTTSTPESLNQVSGQAFGQSSVQSEVKNAHQVRNERLHQAVLQMRENRVAEGQVNSQAEGRERNPLQSDRNFSQNNKQGAKGTQTVTQAPHNANATEQRYARNAIEQRNATARQNVTSQKNAALQRNVSTQERLRGDSAQAASPFPSTLIDVNQLQMKAQQPRPDQEELLNTGDLLVRSLFTLVVAWRLLALYCIYHAGQGVVINFQKRMITIYHDWMVENILMTDVEHIDVVEPVETTLSRRHLQNILPKVNAEGIRITYAVAKENDEEAVPELKCTIIKGYSPRQLQKMFDILNQIY